MKLTKRTRLLIVLSVAWVVGWAIGLEITMPYSDWDEDFKGVVFVLFGLLPAIVPWAIAWILQAKN